MGVQTRQTSKNDTTRGVIATLSSRRTQAARVPDRTATLRILAVTYRQIADNLLDQIHGHSRGDRATARKIGQHLDWVGARAQMVDSFIDAGESALSYLCTSPESHDRLARLVQLASRHAAVPSKLSVALFLLEKIDEELRLA